MPRGSRPGERRGGRQKGTKNKRTVILGTAKEAMLQEGCNPLVVLAKAANGEIKSDLRVRAASELAKYGWPMLNRNELSGVGGGPVQMEMFESPAERIAGKLARLAARVTPADAGQPDGSGISSAGV